MNDYIERKVVLKAFKLIAKNLNKDYQRGMQDTIDCLVPEVIADIPIADVQPVKHGHWSEIYHDNENYSADCSNCGEPTVRRVYYKPYDFCPHCGAKMDEEVIK